jgi:hypothetical protein
MMIIYYVEEGIPAGSLHFAPFMESVGAFCNFKYRQLMSLWMVAGLV